MKKEFVLLCNLLDITYEMDTEEDKAKWVRNVLNSVGTEGYNCANDDSGSYITEMFACDEMEFADVTYYDFMGSATEQERFYARDIVTFKNKANGNYYVLNAEDLGEF